MITTSLDVLYIVLASCAGILTIVVSMFLIRVTRVLKQTQDILTLTEQVLDSIDRYVKLPTRALFTVIDRVRIIQERFRKRRNG